MCHPAEREGACNKVFSPLFMTPHWGVFWRRDDEAGWYHGCRTRPCSSQILWWITTSFLLLFKLGCVDGLLDCLKVYERSSGPPKFITRGGRKFSGTVSQKIQIRRRENEEKSVHGLRRVGQYSHRSLVHAI